MLQARHIPNLICVMRIVLVVPIVMSLLEQNYLQALWLIIIAGVSDGLDGFLARRYDWTSRIGGLLDPLADKLLFVSVFASLSYMGLIPLWLFAVVIGRDIIIIAGAAAYEFLIGPVEPNPSKVGKLNTVMALLYLFFVMTSQVWGWPPEVSVLITGAGVFVVSLVSGLDYVLTWSRLAMQSRAPA
ncbi:MAG: CDP-alcohol phosphatidyltransferase family protein [Gammaproteobacteria bacterium]|nr:CDP-alcohol phosphatidyltransferase family protein [Gammaproteobacteria bacterium]